ncbi:MAG TPA: hypothetical protein VEU29_03110 [Actinomycetota bacterium]|nr:hypothetical protein [Actinomycetota bacterium]
MRKRVAVLGVLLLAAAVLQTSSLVAAQTGDGEDCVVPDDAALHASSRPTKEGHFPHEEWIASPASQRAVDNVNRALDGEFGTTSKTDTTAPLDRGLVGLALDHHSQKVVVVADFDRVDEQGLERRLRGLVQASDSGRTPFDLDVSPSCHPAAELHAASDVLHGRSWHSRADEVAFASYLDPKTSTYRVAFSREDEDVARALEAELGERVTIEWGSPGRDGRLDDGEPHYGGAGIRFHTQTTNQCTSGFTVVFSNGLKGSVTAGHCYNNGYNVYSGPQYYGKTEGKAGFPNFDMMRINPNGERFTYGLHVDPCCPAVREVVSDSNAAMGNLICISGMVTKAKCGLEVIKTNGELCDSDGCTYDLVVAEKPGYTVRAKGDSGAPMYTGSSTTQTATIKGMHIGGFDPSTSYSEKISNIKSHLAVTVLRKL